MAKRDSAPMSRCRGCTAPPGSSHVVDPRPVVAGNAIEAEVPRGYDWGHHKMWGVEDLTDHAPSTIVNVAPMNGTIGSTLGGDS